MDAALIPNALFIASENSGILNEFPAVPVVLRGDTTIDKYTFSVPDGTLVHNIYVGVLDPNYERLKAQADPPTRQDMYHASALIQFNVRAPGTFYVNWFSRSHLHSKDVSIFDTVLEARGAQKYPLIPLSCKG